MMDELLAKVREIRRLQSRLDGRTHGPKFWRYIEAALNMDWAAIELVISSMTAKME
jgi:hypothetical protein